MTGRRRDLGRKEVAAMEMENRRKRIEEKKEREVEAAIEVFFLVWKLQWRSWFYIGRVWRMEFDRSSEIFFFFLLQV